MLVGAIEETNHQCKQSTLIRQFDTRVPNTIGDKKKLGRVLQSNRQHCQLTIDKGSPQPHGREKREMHALLFIRPESSKHPRRQRNGAQLDLADGSSSHVNGYKSLGFLSASLALTCFVLSPCLAPTPKFYTLLHNIEYLDTCMKH